MQLGKEAAMDPLHDFDRELAFVFDACKRRIGTYPDEFQETALHYLDRYNVFRDGFNKNYICYVLPFWLGQSLTVDKDICCQISVAGVFKFFYFLVQDAVMDTGPGEYKADLLPLGNLFLFDFMEHYRRLFPDDSLFWRYTRQYFEEWAHSTHWERDTFWTKHQRMTPADLPIIAHKAAPVKMINAAMAILSGKPEAIGAMDAMIDTILISAQLLDDCLDWQQDLKDGNCTYFLSQVMNHYHLDDFAAMTETLVKKAVYFGDIIPEIFGMVKNNHRLLKKTKNPFVPYLITFHETFIKSFEEVLQRIHTRKKAILAGGFSNWLDKYQS
jgi:hypothetical protein